MKRDIGFWDIDNNYIPDIQDVEECELSYCKLADNVTKLYEILERIKKCSYYQ